METSILSFIKEHSNKFIDDLLRCSNSGFPTYVYGAGEGADNVIKRARNVGFEFAGKCIDREYFSANNSSCDCLEDLIEDQIINLVVAHRGFTEEKLDFCKDKIHILVDRDCFAGNYEADPEMMTYEFVKQHDHELTNVYNRLYDRKSQESLIAYINQKISMDYSYLRTVKSECQYFDPDVIKLSENEALLDGGAYIGDTVDDFLTALKREKLMGYNAIYSFEPDPSNYKILCSRQYDNFFPYCIATSNRTEKVSFQQKGKGSSSAISNAAQGEEVISDTIDNVLKGKPVTFIKLDVEGYELAALEGAKETIIKNRPKCAICIYHKKEDLWQIQDYIDSLVDGYRYYIRAYEQTATELVLYALPE